MHQKNGKGKEFLIIYIKKGDFNRSPFLYILFQYAQFLP